MAMQNLTARELKHIIRGIQSNDVDRANAAKRRLIALEEWEIQRLLASLSPNPRSRYAVNIGAISIIVIWCAAFGWRSMIGAPQVAGLICSAIHSLYIRNRKNQFAYALEVLVSAQKPTSLQDRIRALQCTDTRLLNAVMPGVIDGITQASDTDLNLLSTEVVSVLANCLSHQYTSISLLEHLNNTETLDLELRKKLDIAILNRAVAMPSANMVAAVKSVFERENSKSQVCKLANEVMPLLLEAEERRKSGEGLLRIPRDHRVDAGHELLRPTTETEEQISGRR